MQRLEVWVFGQSLWLRIEYLLCRLKLQINHFCADSSSKRMWWIWLQINHYCADSNSKLMHRLGISNESLMHRIMLQMNLYHADSGSKWITIVETLAPNESLLCRLRLLMNHYCADSGSKWRYSQSQTHLRAHCKGVKSRCHVLTVQCGAWKSRSRHQKPNTKQRKEHTAKDDRTWVPGYSHPTLNITSNSLTLSYLIPIPPMQTYNHIYLIICFNLKRHS